MMHVIYEKTAPACFPPNWRKRNLNTCASTGHIESS